MSPGGEKYFVSFIDDYSRRLWMYPVKKKSDVFMVFTDFKARAELKFGKRIMCLRTNNGGEYTNGDFLTFCKQASIRRPLTIACTLVEKTHLVVVKIAILEPR